MVAYFADKYNWKRAEYGRPPLATRPASAGFAKELSGEFIIADTFTDEGALLIPVESGFFKHLSGEHDQKTHGAWATGGSDYDISSVQEMLLTSDNSAKKVYAAEYALHRPMNEKLAPISDRPVAPVRGKEDWDEYSAAYDIYENKFNSWVLKRNSLIISDVGRKHLDGTKKGIQNYVNEVVTSESFVNDFGDGGQMGIPPVKITNNKQNVSGVYRMGYRNGKYFTTLGIDRRYASDEATILHEIAHYATSISQRSHFEAHGYQYVLNHLSLVEDVMGVEMADELKSAYEDQGISL
jgi:putative metallohydrolase (TIGR04338 family)